MLILAAIVAAVIVPVGFALSPDSAPGVAPLVRPSSVVAYTAIAAPIVVPVVPSPGADGSVRTWFELPAAPDAVKLLFVGTIFLGLAAAVRRAV